MTSNNGRVVLEQERVFDATPEQIYGLLTEPTALAKWWGPHGFAIPEIHIDLQVGGSLRITMQPPDGGPFHLSGEFLQIEFPSELTFTFRWDEPVPDDRETVVELSLDSHDRRTTLSLTQGEFATEERLELHRSGWADSFEKLDAIIKARRAQT